MSTGDVLVMVFGLLQGLLMLAGTLFVLGALAVTLAGRMAGMDPRHRRWGRVRGMLIQGLTLGSLGLLGGILGASVPDLLGLPIGALILLWILILGISLLAFGLIPRKLGAGEAGASTRAMAMRRKRILMAVTLGGGLLLIAAALLLGESRALGIGGAGLLALALMIRLGSDLLDRIARRGERAVRRAERGAYAEEQVGRILEELGDGFFVIHDLESPYGNIDHLVITREGRMFLLETKSHPGRITADGDRLLRNGRPIEKDPIQQILRNILWLKGRLRELIGREPWIEGVVVFSRAFVPADLVVRGVRVQNIRYLRQTLQRPGRGDPALWEARERIRQALKGKPKD
jgi:hypothetical protein